MKYLTLFFMFLFAAVVIIPAFADNTCTNQQVYNGGSVNNNCNNNSNSQSQSQTQNNNQSVNIMPAVQGTSTATVLPHTGTVDGILLSLFASLPLGFMLRKKA